MPKEKMKVKNFEEVMLKLLGRGSFSQKDIKEIITFKKGAKSKNYIKGYNSCNGKNKVSRLAEIIGVTSSTLSPILKQWYEEGILYIVETNSGWFYKKLFTIK